MRLIKLGGRIINMDLVVEVKVHAEKITIYFAVPNENGAMTGVLTDENERAQFLGWVKQNLEELREPPATRRLVPSLAMGAGEGLAPVTSPAQSLRDAEAQKLIQALEEGDAYAPSINAEQAISRALPEAPPAADVNLNVPYIHQMWDTPNSFDGRWACGPTSTAMVLAYYGLLEPKPITLKKPSAHENDYGWYVASSFEHGGRTFDDQAKTKTGAAPGLYGAIVHDGMAQGDIKVEGVHKGFLPVLRTFFTPVGNTVEFVAKPTWKEVSEALDEGHPVIISGHVFGYPHIIVIRGYAYDKADNVFHWIVNDPHGYMNKGTYNGENVAYRWREIYHPDGEPSKYMFRIRGPFKPTP